MAKRTILWSGGFLLVALAVAGWAAGASAQGKVGGMLFGQDLKTPLSAAVVKLKAADGARRYESRPTSADGVFEIDGVEAGTYVLGISAPEGDFNFDYNVIVKADEVAALSLGVRLAGEPQIGEMAGVLKQEKDPVPYFDAPAGMAVLGEGGSDLVISCIHKPKPPKPPKSKHNENPHH